MSKQFLFVVVLSLVSLIAVSCTFGGFPRLQFNSPPNEPQPGEPTPGQPMVFFGANKTSIQPGECITLEWRVEGEGFFGVELNGQPVNASGQQQVCPPESAVYNLAVDIGSTMLRHEVAVAVAGIMPPGAQGMVPGQPQQPGTPGQQPVPTPPPPGALPSGCGGYPHVTLFEIVPAAIQQGQTAKLNWGPITNGASGPLVGSVSISPGGAGNVGSPGSLQVSPSTTTTYTLTATGCGGTATATVTLTVVPTGNPVPQLPPGGNSWAGPMLIVPGTLIPQNPPGGGSWSGPQPNPPGGNAWGGPESPGTKYDFMLESNCTAAEWYTSPPNPKAKHPWEAWTPALWLGDTSAMLSESNQMPYTRWLYSGEYLEDLSSCTIGRPGLLMRPPWASSSLIHGTYKMNYTIGEKDYLVGKVGYINEVTPGTFISADFKAWVNWADNSASSMIPLAMGKTRDGKLASFKVPLGNTWKGRVISSIVLEVFAIHGTQDIRTVWVETKLIKE